MRNPRSPRLTIAATEDLLDGRGAPTPLRGLLAAAAAAGRAEEIAGEAAARAAFAAARMHDRAPVPERTTLRRTIVSKLLAAKMLALVILAAGATGGVALAANATLAREPVTAHPATTAPRNSADERRPAGNAVTTSGVPGTGLIGTAEREGGPDTTDASAAPQQHSDGSACGAKPADDGCAPRTGQAHAQADDATKRHPTVAPSTTPAVPTAQAPRYTQNRFGEHADGAVNQTASPPTPGESEHN